MNTSCVWYVGIGGEKLLFSCLAHNFCEGGKSRRVTFNPKSGGLSVSLQASRVKLTLLKTHTHCHHLLIHMFYLTILLSYFKCLIHPL